MKHTTTYIIVDREGAPIHTEYISPGIDIPVQMKSVRVTEEGDMVITLEYQHGEPS